MRISQRTHRALFGIWFGVVLPPILVSAFVFAFIIHPVVGVAMLAFGLVWMLDMGETTCSRCSSYGTANCGVQGLIVPLLWKRRRIQDVKRWRVVLHYWLDVAMMVAMCGAYLCWGGGVWMVIPLIWVAVAWVLVYGPKRHHGLLYVLKREPETSPPLINIDLNSLSTSTRSTGAGNNLAISEDGTS